MAQTGYSWKNDKLTVVVEDQTWNAAEGHLDHTVYGQISGSAEWWLETAVDVLDMLTDKRGPDGQLLLGSSQGNPAMIGDLVAAKLEALRSQRRR